MPTSPTQSTLKWIRDMGYMAAVVERWNSHVKIRQDLFGIIDILAVGHGRTVAIQSTSDNGGNLAKRIAKMQESEALGTLCDAGWIVIAQAWKKPKHRWQSREFRIYPGIQEELWTTTLTPSSPIQKQSGSSDLIHA